MKKEFKFPAVKSVVQDYTGTLVVSANNEKAATAKLVKLMEGEDWKSLCNGSLKDKDIKVEGKWKANGDSEREHALHVLDVMERVDNVDKLAVCIKAGVKDEDVKGYITVTLTEPQPVSTGTFSIDWSKADDVSEEDKI